MRASPRPTNALLVSTLVVTGWLFMLVARRGRITARETALVLAVLSALFLLRVAGQIVVLLRSPSWLPPMEQWHLMPYRLLLPVQLAFLVIMLILCVGLWTENGALATRHPGIGRGLLLSSALYAGGMALRYVVRMARRPTERWFGGAIPIVFHMVLATFLFTLGRYHVAT